MPLMPRRLLQASVPVVLALVASLLVAAPSQAADTGSISGKVTARFAGGSAAPWAEARVYVDRLHDEGGNDNAFGSAEPNSSGNFTVAGLPDGKYQIRTYPKDYGQLTELGYEYYDNKWGPYATTTVQISGGNAVTLAKTIELQQIGHVKGRVVDEQGRPMAGADVSFRQSDSGSYSTRTNANGEYDSLEGEWSDNLIPGSYLVSASASGYDIDDPVYQYEELPVTVTAGGTHTRDIVMKRQPVAVFTVLDTNGQPLANAPLSIQVRDADLNDGQWGPIQSGPHETDSTGRYRFHSGHDEYKVFFGLPVGYTGTAVGEHWDNAYALKDAKVLSFLGGVALRRDYTVQLGTAPTIRPGAPTVTGTTKVGQTLTVNPGTWAPSGVTTSVQWLSFGRVIPGADERELTLTADLQDEWISVRVTGSKSGEKSVDVVKDVGVVGAGLPPVTFTRPTVSGIAKVGRTLTANPGAWGPTGVALAYQWLAGGTAIAGATRNTVTLAPAQQGKALSVRVTGTRSGYTSVSRTSAATAAVQAGTLTAAKPRIIGTAKVGKRLAAVAGAWGPKPVTLSYQWFRDGKRIAGSTRITRVLTKADRGHRISVTVTGRKTGYQTSTATSARTARIR